MECPYCKMNMRKGYLQSARIAFWGEKKKKHIISPNPEDDIPVTKGYWAGCYADAWVCRRCKKMIIDLEF